MSTENEPDRTTTTQAAPRDVVRLSVNLATDVASALKKLSADQGVSVTEGVRRAVVLWKLISDERSKGNRMMVVEGEGESARYRELIFL